MQQLRQSSCKPIIGAEYNRRTQDRVIQSAAADMLLGNCFSLQHWIRRSTISTQVAKIKEAIHTGIDTSI